MIITIDGPVASGKSTIARLLAEQLGYVYINSGFLFRGLAYIYVRERNYSIEHLQAISAQEVRQVLGQLDYTYSLEQGARICIDGVDITPLLKEPEIDQAASLISTDPSVRQALLEYQRDFAHDKNTVVDGRDSGTVVFPAAEYKFYLTASTEVRAHRWQREQALKGRVFSLEESMEIIKERDDRDCTREVAPLKPASEALIIDTSTLTMQDVLAVIIDALPF
jgi:CMP/dCMP kinase